MKKYWTSPCFVMRYECPHFSVWKLSISRPACKYLVTRSGFEAQLFKERLERERDKD